jgi:hypothetical protein
MSTQFVTPQRGQRPPLNPRATPAGTPPPGTPTQFATSGEESGIPAYGTAIQVWTGTDFATISGVGDITGPNTSIAEVETTSHSTGAPHRTFIPTLIDDGELSFPSFWQPTDPTQSITSTYGLEYLFQNRIITRFRLINTDTAHRTREFKGFVRNLGETYPVQGVVTRNVTIRITSVPTDTASPISLTPTSAAAPAAGTPAGTFDIELGGSSTPYACVPDQGWITVTDPVGTTSGDQTVNYTVAAQAPAAPARTGHIMMAAVGLTFTIDQAAGV